MTSEPGPDEDRTRLAPSADVVDAKGQETWESLVHACDITHDGLVAYTAAIQWQQPDPASVHTSVVYPHAADHLLGRGWTNRFGWSSLGL